MSEYLAPTDTITQEERHQLLQLVKRGKQLEQANADLLERLQNVAMSRVNKAEAEGAILAGDNLKDILAIADTTTKFTKAIREDENIQAKLAKKAQRKSKVNPFDDAGLNEARLMMQALAKRFSPEQLQSLVPIVVEQQ